MSQDIEVYEEGKIEGVAGSAVPDHVFALTFDYTAATMAQLENIRTLIGGGNGPVVKMDATALNGDDNTRHNHFEFLAQILTGIQFHHLYLLVPWGLQRTDEIIEVMYQVSRRRPFLCFKLGGDLYSIELCMKIDDTSIPNFDADGDLLDLPHQPRYEQLEG